MDIATMKPTTKKVPAKTASKGNTGSALASLLLKAADKQAEAEVKQADSRKDTLASFLKFTRDDHLAFREELNARLDLYKSSAATLNLTFEAFKQSDPKANSVSVTVSLWLKMSQACETGWRPEMDQSWGYISIKATEALHAKALAHVGTADNPQRAAPTVKAKKGRPAKSNVDKALAVLDGMPLQDLETIAKWIVSKLGKGIEYQAIKKAPIPDATM
ncbi:MAG: hypothetical protein ACK5PF_07565 [bacterium]